MFDKKNVFLIFRQILEMHITLFIFGKVTCSRTRFRKRFNKFLSVSS